MGSNQSITPAQSNKHLHIQDLTHHHEQNSSCPTLPVTTRLSKTLASPTARTSPKSPPSTSPPRTLPSTTRSAPRTTPPTPPSRPCRRRLCPHLACPVTART